MLLYILKHIRKQPVCRQIFCSIDRYLLSIELIDSLSPNPTKNLRECGDDYRNKTIHGILRAIDVTYAKVWENYKVSGVLDLFSLLLSNDHSFRRVWLERAMDLPLSPDYYISRFVFFYNLFNFPQMFFGKSQSSFSR